MYPDLSVDLQSLWNLFQVTAYYPSLQFFINYPLAATSGVIPVDLKLLNKMSTVVTGTWSCRER